MAKLTNKYNLPHAFVEACAGFMSKNPPKPGTISVTAMLKPPQMHFLESKHFHDIEEDAMDRLWALFGSAVHGVLQKAAERKKTWKALSEEFLTINVNGWEVRGVLDQFELETADGKSNVLSDWKVVKAFALIGEGKLEWEQQLNVYRYMLHCHGIECDHLEIRAIVRDHSTREAQKNSDYPQQPFAIVPVPLWPIAEAKAFVEYRVAVHAKASKGEYPPCSKAERWAKDDVWAVFAAEGAPRAINGGLMPSHEEAHLKAKTIAMKNMKPAFIQYRPATSVRCDYCRARPWCIQYQQIRADQRDKRPLEKVDP
jgi:hypothetical protein